MTKRTTISIRYEIAQNVRSWILKRKYTAKDLANETGIKYYTLPRYVKGKCGIPTEKLKRIARDVRFHGKIHENDKLSEVRFVSLDNSFAPSSPILLYVKSSEVRFVSLDNSFTPSSLILFFPKLSEVKLVSLPLAKAFAPSSPILLCAKSSVVRFVKLPSANPFAPSLPILLPFK